MTVFLALAAAAFSLAVGYLVWRRIRRQEGISWRLSLYAVAAGMLAGVVAVYIEQLVLAGTGLDFDVRVAGVGGALMATFLLAAPLEEAAKVLVVWPLYRTRRVAWPRLGVGYATAAAAGFAAAEGVWIVLSAEEAPLAALRTSLSALAHIACAGAWGYALGASRTQGHWFGVTWMAAVLLHGLFDHIVWGRGPGYLVATLPLLAFMGLGAWIALRSAPSNRPSRPSRPAPLEPTAFREVRRAIVASEKPVMLRWILAGSFVTLGLVIALFVLSVFLGRRFGFDFALADEADVRSAAPLMVLGTAVLLAFPISGYLIARASASPTVLEPALANLLALAALVTILALTAPIAVLFALAVAPVALGFACGGAWIGLER